MLDWVRHHATAIVASLGHVCLWLFVFGVSGEHLCAAEPGPIAWRTGARLHAALDQPLTATWQQAELRDVLRQLAANERVAILLDRRIDPHSPVEQQFVQMPLRDGLAAIATAAGAAVSWGEEVIYVGPPTAARDLQTLLRLRHANPPATYGKAWPRVPRAGWDNLAQPREMIEGWFTTASLTPPDLSAVPYDLWSGCDLPPMALSTALQLVLIQYDMSWSNTNGGLELVTCPSDPALTRQFRLGKKTIESVQQAAPELRIERNGAGVVAHGRWEELENLERWLIGGPAPKPKAPEVVPLSQRRFTLTCKREPLQRVLDQVAATGMEIVFDADRARELGIDWKTPITLTLQDVDAETFFQELLAPLRVQFKLEGVRLQILLPPAAD